MLSNSRSPTVYLGEVVGAYYPIPSSSQYFEIIADEGVPKGQNRLLPTRYLSRQYIWSKPKAEARRREGYKLSRGR